MFFIYGTDAPIYHYPIVTSAMIVVNVAVHVLIGSLGIDILPWILAFGDGFHPLQWLTHNFLHAGWLHLIGNMIFLFPFGLIVEGKIGWLRMLVLYLGIGMGQGFTQQLIMLPTNPMNDAQALVAMFEDPENPMDEETKEELARQWREDLRPQDFGSLGASAIIFGLLAVCMIWAPVNHFDVYFRWSLLVPAPDGGQREWTVATVGGMFVAKEFLMFLMMGMTISSEALHLNGFIVGGVFGLATLYYGLVDCEGFDLISLWSGNQFKAERTKRIEQRQRAAAIEAAKPQGPPPAVVPLMPHQMAMDATVTPRPVPHVAVPPMPEPSGPDSIPLEFPTVELASQASEPNSTPALAMPDLALPEFDDGTTTVDPQIQVKNEIEACILRGEFSDALKRFAKQRKHDPQFILAPTFIGKLAEGLIRSEQIKSAIKVLIVGGEAYPVYQPRWRIRIASLELSARHDPIAAIKQLQKVDKGMLDSRLRSQYVKVAEHAKRMASQ